MSDADRPFVDKKRYDQLSRGGFLRIAEEQALSQGSPSETVIRKAEMRDQITEAIRQALNSSRQVEITFKREATDDVVYLLRMIESTNLGIEDADVAILWGVVHSKKWEDDNNRTVKVTLFQNFDQSWFIGRMRRALENIIVVPQ